MRLLLAEDELALSKALTQIMERNNYSVVQLMMGQEAWSIWKQTIMMALFSIL